MGGSCVDKAKERIRKQRWNDRNRGTLNEASAWYRAKVLGRIPPWAEDERAQMKLVYEQAVVDSEGSRKFEVDHEYPLNNSDSVCGLHCLANLRIVPRVENRRTWSIKNKDRYEQR